jgi:hypothetical protein
MLNPTLLVLCMYVACGSCCDVTRVCLEEIKVFLHTEVRREVKSTYTKINNRMPIGDA